MPPTDYHLSPDEYPMTFPSGLDAVPVLIQKHTFIDHWIFNRMFDMLQTVQQFIVDNSSRIEA